MGMLLWSIMDRKQYPSDLTDAQWAVLRQLLPSAEPGGRPRHVDLLEVVNALLYVPRTGCSWRQRPHVPRNSARPLSDPGRWIAASDHLIEAASARMVHGMKVGFAPTATASTRPNTR